MSIFWIWWIKNKIWILSNHIWNPSRPTIDPIWMSEYFFGSGGQRIGYEYYQIRFEIRSNLTWNIHLYYLNIFIKYLYFFNTIWYIRSLIQIWHEDHLHPAFTGRNLSTIFRIWLSNQWMVMLNCWYNFELIFYNRTLND